MDRYIFQSHSSSATYNLGKQIGEKLVVGSIIALIGELGCGKTLFTKGICVGLDVPERRVNSPTFAFVNEYSGRLHVYHIDLYRLNTIEEGFEIGMLDYLNKAEAGVLVMEWAEKIPSLLPRNYLQVEFQVLSARRRQLTFIGFGDKFDNLIRGMNGS